MPIAFGCSCGKSLRVSDEHAGKRAKCPACGGVAAVPRAEPAFEVIEDAAEPSAPPKAKPVAARADEDDDRRGYPVSSRRADEDDRPKKRPKWQADRGERERRPRRGGGPAGGEVIGGLVAMLLGGVLFALALANDRLPIYGSVLFACGLVGLVKGLNGGGRA